MVKATIKTFFCLAVLAGMSTFSHAASDGGVIHFRGAIVEGGCGFSPQEQKVNITCSNKGKSVTHSVSLSGLNNGAERGDSLVQTDLRYLDPQKRLAVLSVTYP